MRELKIVAEFPDYGITEDGKVYSFKSRRWLTPYTLGTGYLGIRMSKTPNNFKNLLIHRLVAEMFLPKVSCKNCINHKDLNKQNPHVSNLEWCTLKENSRHAYDNGVLKDVSVALSDRESLVFSMLQAGARVKDIAYKAGCSRQLVTHVKKGRAWKKAALEYGFIPE
jgi:hypothetical protein